MQGYQARFYLPEGMLSHATYALLNCTMSDAGNALPSAAIKSLIYRIGAGISQPLTATSRIMYRLGMTLKFKSEWSVPPYPEWFNHEFDIALFHNWRRPHFFERGVYASELVPRKRVLDLCCGDGSVAALFLSPLAERVVAVDFDPDAISYARRAWKQATNVSYEVMDIRELDVKDGAFDICTWDAAIEHFTKDEMDRIMAHIKRALTSNGILHGHTIEERDHEQHHDHEYEFKSVGELKQFLLGYFKSVQVWERVHKDRSNLYFRCSDDKLPER